jgi:O-antigen/teichoic acid export membrane protein
VRSVVDRLPGRGRVVHDSALMLTTTVLMALSGSLFWAVAARTSDQVDVGLAGSVIAATVTFSYLSLLGLNHTLIKMLPHSRAPRMLVYQATGLVFAAGAVLAVVYLVVMRWVSPSIAAVFEHPLEQVSFVVIVAASGVNLLSDAILLSVGALVRNLLINGVLMGALKVLLPFALAQLGAFGLVACVGISSVVAAALSIVVAVSKLAPSRSGTAGLRRALGFAGAGYVASVANMLPILILPTMVLQRLGADVNAVYFICFQIASLLNAVAYTINSSSFAHASRRPHEAAEVVRTTLRLLLGAVAVGALALAATAPWLLAIFGQVYREQGTVTLQLMAFASLPLALNNWYAVRLRLRSQLWAMVMLQVVVSTSMVAAAWLLLPRGLEWMAAALAIGYLSGLPLGYLTTRGKEQVVVLISEER